MLNPTPQSGLVSPAVEVSSWRAPVATSTAQMPAPPTATAIRVPSGDHDGAASVIAFVVSRCWPVPSAFIAYSSALPSRVEMKPIRAPSGDQVGSVFAPPLCERSVGTPPPDGTVKTSAPSSKAIVAPFGENTGLLPVAIAAERPEPLAFIVLISPAPFRKTSFVPSGDHEGVVPAAPVSTAPEPSSAIVRIVPPETYATRSPSGETDGCDPATNAVAPEPVLETVQSVPPRSKTTVPFAPGNAARAPDEEQRARQDGREGQPQETPNPHRFVCL